MCNWTFWTVSFEQFQVQKSSSSTSNLSSQWNKGNIQCYNIKQGHTLMKQKLTAQWLHWMTTTPLITRLITDWLTVPWSWFTTPIVSTLTPALKEPTVPAALARSVLDDGSVWVTERTQWLFSSAICSVRVCKGDYFGLFWRSRSNRWWCMCWGGGEMEVALVAAELNLFTTSQSLLLDKRKVAGKWSELTKSEKSWQSKKKKKTDNKERQDKSRHMSDILE